MPLVPDTYNYSETRKRTADSYLKFSEDYRNVIRILNPEAKRVWKHWIQEANAGRGMTANCPNDQLNKICPIDKALISYPKDDPEVSQRRAKARYIVNVLDRTPVTTCKSCNSVTPGKTCATCKAPLKGHDFEPLNKVKLLEQGPRLFKETLGAVEKMQAEDFDGVDITEYDITLTTNGSGRERRIAAIPQKPEPLDDAWLLDKETGEAQKLFDLDNLAEPTSVEEIELMLKGATVQELNAVRGIA